MKKTLGCIVLLVFLMIPSITVRGQDGAYQDLIFIEGTASNTAHQIFFMQNFRMEAAGLGFNVVADKADAEHTFRFEVAPTEEGDFLITTKLIANENDAELVSLSRYFNDLEESYEFNQILFFQTVILIPRTGIIETVIVQTVVDENDDWRNKWLYLRGSIDYPITFYILRPNGLIGGTGVYYGTYENPTRVSPIDNRTTALPGITLGLEIQFLNWMSIEPIFQVILGDPDNLFAIAAGVQLKIPIKLIRNLMLEPYGAITFPLNSSTAYARYPPLAVGAGLQIAVKGGNSGAFFADLNYMLSLRNAILKNPYEDMYPNPHEIHFRRSVIGIGIGYKFGLFNRRR